MLEIQKLFWAFFARIVQLIPAPCRRTTAYSLAGLCAPFYRQITHLRTNFTAGFDHGERLAMSVFCCRLSKIRFVVLAVAFMASPAALGQPASGGARPVAVTVPETFEAAIAECRRLDAEFNKLTAAGDSEGALALARTQLPLERKTLELGIAKFPGDANAARQLTDRVTSTANYIADAMALKKQFAEARALYLESAEKTGKVYGSENWRPREARAQAEKYDLLAKMPPHDQDKFVRTRSERDEFFKFLGKGEVASAGPLAQSNAEVIKSLFPTDHFEVASSLVNLALWHEQNKQPEEAKRLYLEALPTLRKTFGSHPLTAQVLNSLALMEMNKQDFVAGELLFREAFEIRRETFGANHSITAESALGFGITLFHLQRFRDAVPALAVNRQFLEQRFGADSPQLDTTLFVLGQCLTRLGDYKNAEECLNRVVAFRRASAGEESELLMMALYRLGEVHKTSGDAMKGVAVYEQAVAIARKVLGAEHLLVSTMLNDLGINYYKLKSFAKAQPLFEESLAIRKKVLGHEQDEQIAAMTCNLGHVFRDKGELEKAEAQYVAAIGLAEAINRPAYVNQFRFELAGLHHRMKKFTEAEAGYRQTIKTIEKTQGPFGATGVRERLAQLMAEQEKFPEARAEYEQLYTITLNAVGGDHPFTVDLESKLTDIYTKLNDQEGLSKITDSAKARANRLEAVNNLKQIGLALISHHDVKGNFPAAGSTEKSGISRLSWRVHILPYLEQQELYSLFKLDEPWDSPHNRALIAKMPEVFKTAGAAEGRTAYLGVAGAGTFFGDGTKGMKVSEIRDGMSNTLVVVEADPANAVEWTRPADWQFDPTNPKTGLGERRVNVLFADGSVQQLPPTFPVERLPSMVTAAGNDVVERE
jgi:prepilin-type processing-associated H-X9-DG protein